MGPPFFALETTVAPGLPEWAQVVERLGLIGFALIIVYLFVANRVGSTKETDRAHEAAKANADNASDWKEIALSNQRLVEKLTDQLAASNRSGELSLRIAEAFSKVVGHDIST